MKHLTILLTIITLNAYSQNGNVGIGNQNPQEKLDVTGAVRVGNTSNNLPGTIRWTGGELQGRNNSEWLGLGIPTGAIIMWSGSVSSIPVGWALCNGSSGTPDLRGRFIVGYNPNDPDYNSIGDNGGEKRHTLSINEMPSHNHTGNTNSAGNHSHTVNDEGDFTTGNPGGYIVQSGANQRNSGVQTQTTNFTGSHSHSLTINDRGSSQSHENRPPYYTLAYIIKL